MKLDVEKLRKSLGLTVDDFCKLVGVCFTSYHRWVTGYCVPSKKHINRLNKIIERAGGRTEDFLCEKT